MFTKVKKMGKLDMLAKVIQKLLLSLDKMVRGAGNIHWSPLVQVEMH